MNENGRKWKEMKKRWRNSKIKGNVWEKLLWYRFMHENTPFSLLKLYIFNKYISFVYIILGSIFFFLIKFRTWIYLQFIYIYGARERDIRVDENTGDFIQITTYDRITRFYDTKSSTKKKNILITKVESKIL